MENRTRNVFDHKMLEGLTKASGRVKKLFWTQNVRLASTRTTFLRNHGTVKDPSGSLCNLLHPSLSYCCPCSSFASPSLHLHSILAGPWHHPYYQSPNPSTRIRPPFHSHFTAYPFLGLFTSLSASFFSVGGDRGRQEAVEKWQGKAQRKRGKAQVDRYQWDKH